MNELRITQPDDWHLHLRDEDALKAVLPYTARQCGRAIIMPNLTPPVTTLEAASGYRERILAALPEGSDFEPLMTLYLTDHTGADEVEKAWQSGIVHAVKLYPAGATTNSASGVTNIRHCDAALSAMEALGMPLLVHGEVTAPGVDIFDREAVFIEEVMEPLLERHPNLRVVFEHITTVDAVAFVERAPANIGATITAHHLLFNRNHMLVGGVRPHYFCLPILKRETHRAALLKAATSGSPKFFLGTDSAPHRRQDKEAASGCAGAFTAPAAIELYATAFDQAGALDKLEGFASHFGADFYGLPRNSRTLTLRRESWRMPETLAYAGDDCIVPLMAGESIPWKLVQD
ncbi:dihydroorotase [Pistricoccus aurantiacus]|uniref:Dihydroorotase n=1 Tax=Pistricoccus aurantiacus TaxID=1883414 RepID=A0A5B8SYI9_9GAMM|nr:dihydroorotase [Pistricoccus aurantiacus]QEA39880.1 dihydroorotase [Pistricoccus aurantiacus]